MAVEQRPIIDIEADLGATAQRKLILLQQEYVRELFNAIAASVNDQGPRDYIKIKKGFSLPDEWTSNTIYISGVEIGVVDGEKKTAFALEATHRIGSTGPFVKIRFMYTDGAANPTWRQADQFLLSDNAVFLPRGDASRLGDDVSRYTRKIVGIARTQAALATVTRAVAAEALALQQAERLSQWRNTVIGAGKHVWSRLREPGLPRFPFPRLHIATSSRHVIK